MATQAVELPNDPELIKALAQAFLQKFEAQLYPQLYAEVLKKSTELLKPKGSFLEGLKKMFKVPSLEEQKEKIPNAVKQEIAPVLPTTNVKPTDAVPETDAELFKQNTVSLGGITPDGEKRLKEVLPPIFLDIFKMIGRGQKEEGKDTSTGENYAEGGLLSILPKGLLPILGGASLILGGLAALVGAFMTDSGMKGTLELIGKAGLKGGLIVLAKKIFGTSLKLILKRIPIIGTLLSYGFAIQRFSNGDVVGGIIDLVSGTVQLLDLVAPGLGTVLSLGVDIMQAILDAKAGGSSAEASQKKTGILLDWVKGLGSLIWKGIKYVPVIGPFLDAAENLLKGEWVDGLYNMTRAIPGLGLVLDFVNFFSGGKTAEGIKGGIKTLGNWVKGFGGWVYEKIHNVPVIGPLIKAVGFFFKGEWLNGLKALGNVVSPIGSVISFLTGNTEEQEAEPAQQKGPNPFQAIRRFILEKARKWWKSTWSWVRWLAKRVLPTSIIKALDSGEPDSSKEMSLTATQDEAAGPITELKKVGGIIKDKFKDYTTSAVNFLKTNAPNVVKLIKQTGSSLFDAGKNAAKSFIQGVDKVAEWSGEQAKKLAGAFQSAVDSFVQFKDWIAENFISKITNFVKNFIGKTINWAKDKVEGVLNFFTGDKTAEEEQALPEAVKQPAPVSTLPGANTNTDYQQTVTASPPIPNTNIPQNNIYNNVQESITQPEGPTVNNKALDEISANTNKTNVSIEQLVNVMYRFTQVLDKKLDLGGQATNAIFMGGNSNVPSASQIAANNVDPIRQVRQQFAY